VTTITELAATLAAANAGSGITADDWQAGLTYHVRRNADPGMTRPETEHAHARYTEASARVTAAQGPRGADRWDAICARQVVAEGLSADPLAGVTAAEVRAMFR